MKFILKTAISFLFILFIDLLLYGEVFPLLGLYIGSYISAYFKFTLVVELLLVAGCTVLLFFLSLSLRLEKIFWKKLYTLSGFYKVVLHARDLVNVIYVGTFVSTLVTTTFNTTLLASTYTSSDSQTILQQPIEAFVHIVCYRMEFYGLTNSAWCHSNLDQVSYEAIYEAKVLYAVAYIVVVVAKMLYFNTLFTYLQTLKMFKELQASRAAQIQQQQEAHNRRRTAARQQRQQPRNGPGAGPTSGSPRGAGGVTAIGHTNSNSEIVSGS